MRKLETQKQNEITAAVKAAGVFWAFSDKQFSENKTHSDGEFYSIGAGGYIHETNIEKYKKLNDEIKAIKAKYKALQDKEKYIIYVINNYESHYTGDYTNARATIKDEYPEVSDKEFFEIARKDFEEWEALCEIM
jgi:hypothetical protein